MKIQDFKDIVDNTPTYIKDCQGDLGKLYSYVGIVFQSSYRANSITEALHKKINSAFTAGHQKVRQNCKRMITDLIREHVVFDKPLSPYFEILSCLCDALRGETSTLGGDITGDWNAAIKAARDEVEFSNPWNVGLENLAYTRDFNVAQAARSLREAGFTVLLTPGEIALDEISEMKIVHKIDQFMSKIGGINFLQRYFKILSSRAYNEKLQRYLLVPHTSLGTNHSSPQIPWGYLLQLAVKHIPGRKPFENTEETFFKLLTLAKNYAAIIDVQPYTPLAFLNYGAKEIIRYLQESALYDTMFRFSQIRPSDAVHLCTGLFNFLDLDKTRPGGWNFAQLIEMVAALFYSTPDIRGPITISKNDFYQALVGIPHSAIDYMLNALLSHKKNEANKDFLTPYAASNCNFQFAPLLQTNSNTFIMIDRSICAPACIEALLTAARGIDKQLDNRMGKQAENFLKSEFIHKGISVHCGIYKSEGQDGECDLVLETQDTIFFIELKKKPLTRAARGGQDSKLLLDLGSSILAALLQAGEHELRLRKAGCLRLNDNGCFYTLEHRGRAIEKIAVSMLEYERFQDHLFVQRFLESICGARYTINDKKSADSNKFFDLNENLEKIAIQIKTIPQTKTPNKFFNCWFLSLPQLLVLLSNCSNAKDFQTALMRTKCVTFGTSDFYYEYSRSMELLEKKAPSSTS